MPIDKPENPHMRAFHKSPEQAAHEARAKVFWGDEPDQVIKYLQMQGIGYDDACIMTDSMFSERDKAIRGSGVRKILMGVPLMLVPVVVWAVMSRVGLLDVKLLGCAIAIAIGGAWLCLKGTFMLVMPHTEIGDFADK
jgi:hypothetical protein